MVVAKKKTAKKAKKKTRAKQSAAKKTSAARKSATGAGSKQSSASKTHGTAKSPAAKGRVRSPSAASTENAYEAATIPMMSAGGRPVLSYQIGEFGIALPDGTVSKQTVDLPLVKVGSSSSNDIVVEDSSVSRFHCELCYTSEGFLIRDLDSTNGTYIAGMRVREATISQPTVIQIGRSQLRFKPQAEPTKVDLSPDTQFGKLVGRSVPMREVFGVLRKIGPTDLTVTIQGETGTGKELVARALHDASPRRKGPFIVFDAGSVTASLIESELFGHEKGAFTGASELRKGAFEAANGGTLFVDELGELALDLQPRLLRALEQREIQRVGGNRRIPVDVRVICATNRNLQDHIKKGEFRDDLYFRISVVSVFLPSLRDRLEDIDLLVNNFLSQMDGEREISRASVDFLQQYDWPGNVRELRNVIHAACAMSGNTMLQPNDFFMRSEMDAFAENGTRQQDRSSSEHYVGKSLDDIERSAIVDAIERCDGNRQEAAACLGIAPSTLYLKLKKYGLHA